MSTDTLGKPITLNLLRTERGCGSSMNVSYRLDVTLASGAAQTLYKAIPARLVIQAADRLGLSRDELDELFSTGVVTAIVEL